jgi:hypothetical protein
MPNDRISHWRPPRFVAIVKEKGGPMSTLIGALPELVTVPVSAVLAAVDGRLLFAILWAAVALGVGTLVRSALARTERRPEAGIRIVRSVKGPQRRAA